jgi:hypothetical protein
MWKTEVDLNPPRFYFETRSGNRNGAIVLNDVEQDVKQAALTAKN